MTTDVATSMNLRYANRASWLEPEISVRDWRVHSKDWHSLGWDDSSAYPTPIARAVWEELHYRQYDPLVSYDMRDISLFNARDGDYLYWYEELEE